MKDDRSQQLNCPFSDLATLLKQRDIHLAQEKVVLKKPDSKASPLSAREESKLFLEAMADVTPMACHHPKMTRQPRPLATSLASDGEDQDSISALHNLIRYGEGFIVSQTPEYMESANPGATHEVLRRLHGGQYAIQDHVDLHGFSVAEAAPVLERFIRVSIEKGLRAVLVVHGRGLTSPGEPVLKHKVQEWLTRGPLRKWVIALTSARSCDGGAGATYVLLRRSPMTKSRRKKTRTAN